MKDIKLSNKDLTKLPKDLSKEVVGGFDCSYDQLTSLKGAPKKVNGFFNCNYNRLTTLEGGPKYIGRWFSCEDNPNLSLFEIIKFILNSEIKGKIFSDYDDEVLNKINKNKKDYRKIIRIIFE
jgi:hypothetical protein